MHEIKKRIQIVKTILIKKILKISVGLQTTDLGSLENTKEYKLF